MRKQTKLVAVLSAAALLAVGASMTSFAAKGWTEENGSWYYYDNSGDYVYDEWKKSGNNWFYLGEDGAMVTDSLIEDGDYVYYVNANGAMVTNSWVAVEPGEDDYEEDAPDHYWYYFGSNGKAYKAGESGLSIKTIGSKKYGFDENSRMVYGFVTEEGEKNQDENPFMGAMYYFGSSDDGAMHTDWLQYTDGSDQNSELGGREYADMDEMWFYFKPSNGKMVIAEEGENKIKQYTVRGKKYGFDENGVMVYGWNDNTASEGTASKYFSDQYDGHLQKKGWIYAVPTGEMDEDDYNDEKQRWFYANAQGDLYISQIKSISGKKYLFDENGIMKTGLQWVDDNGDIDSSSRDESSDIIGYDGTANLYYFSASEDDGSMKTGKNIKIELEDDTFTFAFKKNGQAYNSFNGGTEDDGLVDNKIYQNGILYRADSDIKYLPYGFNEEDNTAKYLVGTSGTVVKDGKYVKDGDENWWAVTDNGAVNYGSEDDAKSYARCASNGETFNPETNKCVDAPAEDDAE